jgi:hypothetical protein
MKIRKIPNDIVLIVHRYVHHLRVRQLNHHYHSCIAFQSVNGRLNIFTGEHYKSYNYRPEFVANTRLYNSVLNKRLKRVCDLPKNY